MNIVKQFGSYLRYIKTGCDYERLEKLTGLKAETLREVEQSAPQISVDMMMRFANAFGIKLTNLLRATTLSTRFAQTYDTQKQGEIFVIKPKDVVEYVNYAPKDIDIRTTLQDLVKALKPVSEPIIDTLPELSDDEQRFLVLSGLFTDSSKDMAELFAMGSAFCQQDFRAYLHYLVRKSFAKKGIVEFCRNTNITPESLINMYSGDLTKISFSDILLIDWALLLEGQLVSICWRAAEFELGLIRNDHNEKKNQPPAGWTIQEYIYAQTLMQYYRYYRAILPTCTDWFELMQGFTVADVKEY